MVRVKEACLLRIVDFLHYTTSGPAGRLPGGRHMTSDKYHAGDGAVATCLCGPVYGGDHHAPTLAEWVEFQKLMGVSKVGTSPSHGHRYGCNCNSYRR